LLGEDVGGVATPGRPDFEVAICDLKTAASATSS
jgi:hypothetical protein